MGHGALYEEFPFLKEISRERQKQFEEYFKTAPLWLMDTIQTEKLKKETVFIKEGEPADTIYILVKGVIEATDYRVYGTPYNYMRFDRVCAFGGMEYIMNLDVYRTTLRTVTDCIIMKLSRKIFEKWMYSDIRAMKHEAMQIAEYLLEEGRNSRLFLFLQGSDRLALLFVVRYEQYQKNGTLYVRDSRQNLADETGLCLKSISRGVKKFIEDGLVSKEGRRIMIDRKQYEGLREIVARKIDLD